MNDFYSSILTAYEIPIFESDQSSLLNHAESQTDLENASRSITVKDGEEYPFKAETTSISGLTPTDYLRLKNAARRIGLDIYVVGSRANGKATLTSDWDYVIPGLNSKKRDKIKNSIPGAKTVDKPKNYDLIRSSLNENLPYIKITPSDEQGSSTY